MKENKANIELVSFCGLYCGACKKYLNEKCPGCHENNKAGWCKVRICCMENNYLSCANCKEFPNPCDCKKFNNFISKVFGFIFKSDRAACINRIKEIGNQAYAEEMFALKQQSLKK